MKNVTLLELFSRMSCLCKVAQALWIIMKKNYTHVHTANLAVLLFHKGTCYLCVGLTTSDLTVRIQTPRQIN